MMPYLGGWTSIYHLFWCSLGYHSFDPWPYVWEYSLYTIFAQDLVRGPDLICMEGAQDPLPRPQHKDFFQKISQKISKETLSKDRWDLHRVGLFTVGHSVDLFIEGSPGSPGRPLDLSLHGGALGPGGSLHKISWSISHALVSHSVAKACQLLYVVLVVYWWRVTGELATTGTWLSGQRA